MKHCTFVSTRGDRVTAPTDKLVIIERQNTDNSTLYEITIIGHTTYAVSKETANDIRVCLHREND